MKGSLAEFGTQRGSPTKKADELYPIEQSVQHLRPVCQQSEADIIELTASAQKRRSAMIDSEALSSQLLAGAKRARPALAGETLNEVVNDLASFTETDTMLSHYRRNNQQPAFVLNEE